MHKREKWRSSIKNDTICSVKKILQKYHIEDLIIPFDYFCLLVWICLFKEIKLLDLFSLMNLISIKNIFFCSHSRNIDNLLLVLLTLKDYFIIDFFLQSNQITIKWKYNTKVSKVTAVSLSSFLLKIGWKLSYSSQALT